MVAGSSEDPAVERRRLRVELRDLRKKSGLTQREVAQAMDWSASKVIRIENGDVRISVNDLRVLLAHYGVTDKRTIDQLVQRARTARRESWTDFRDVHSSPFLTYLAFESSASLIRNFQLSLVPGLLQTEEYAVALLTGAYGVTSSDAERRWEARQRRQELHDVPQPPQMFFIVDEAAIRRHVGGPSVMRRQLEQLKEWSGRPHITLQVLPFSTGAHPGMTGPFTLLEFPDPDDDDLLSLETTAGMTTTRDDLEATSTHLDRFFQLEDQALTPQGSLSLMDDILTGLNGPLVPAGRGATEASP